MSGFGYVSVPKMILADAVFGGRISGDGDIQKASTGSDLQLLLVILDAARNSSSQVVEVPQTTITRVLDRENPKRIHDALKRLQNTSMHLGSTILPAIIDYRHIGTGQEPRTWLVQLDRRVIEIAQKSDTDGSTVQLAGKQLSNLSSKYTFGIFCRFSAWLTDSLPSDRAIRVSRRQGKRAFQLDIPLDKVASIFALRDNLRPSEIKRLLVTSSPQCPLKRELSRSDIEIDSFLVKEDAFDRAIGLRVLISTTSIDGFAHINADRKHRENDRIVRKAIRESSG